MNPYQYSLNDAHKYDDQVRNVAEILFLNNLIEGTLKETNTFRTIGKFRARDQTSSKYALEKVADQFQRFGINTRITGAVILTVFDF